jgi:hypothetical protein
MDEICDIRDVNLVANTFFDIAIAISCGSHIEVIIDFNNLLKKLDIISPAGVSFEAIGELVVSVNRKRFKYSPIVFDVNIIFKIYKNILVPY